MCIRPVSVSFFISISFIITWMRPARAVCLLLLSVCDAILPFFFFFLFILIADLGSVPLTVIKNVSFEFQCIITYVQVYMYISGVFCACIVIL